MLNTDHWYSNMYIVLKMINILQELSEISSWMLLYLDVQNLTQVFFNETR